MALTIGGGGIEVEVVGRGPLPDVDILLHFATTRELSADTTAQLTVIELIPGAHAGAFGAGAAEALGLPPTEFQQPDPPADLANFGRADATPTVIAALMAFVSAATLFHVLVLAVQREGRTLAVLRTIGFTSRQLLAAVTCQAGFLMMVSFVCGLPVSIAPGRWAWIVFAESLGAVPEPSVPVAAVAVTAIAALVTGIWCRASPAGEPAAPPPFSAEADGPGRRAPTSRDGAAVRREPDALGRCGGSSARCVRERPGSFLGLRRVGS